MGKKSKSNNKKQSKKNNAKPATNNNSILPEDGLPIYHDPSHVNQTKRKSQYQQYKEATASFWNWLKAKFPSESLCKVSDLSLAVENLTNSVVYSHSSSSQQVVSHNELKVVLNNLDISIDLRINIAQNFEGTDCGHQFMIDTLKYCRKMIRFCYRFLLITLKNDDDESEELNGEDAIGGRFNALLSLNDEESSDEEEEEETGKSLDERRAPRLTPPKTSSTTMKLNVQSDLINGSDKYRCWYFLQSLDSQMGLVDSHFQMVKSRLRGAPHSPTDSYLKLLLEATVATQIAIENVRIMEAELYFDHPHLSSFGHIIAVSLLPTYFPAIKEYLNVPQAVLDKDPNLVTSFTGEMVNVSFRIQNNRVQDELTNKVVKEYAPRFVLPEDIVKKAAAFVLHLMLNEVRFEGQRVSFSEPLKAVLPEPHSMMKPFENIGKDRCILNTHTMCQVIFDVRAGSKFKLLPSRPGFFGPMWKEGSATNKILGEMDQLLGVDILPELIEFCMHNPLPAFQNHDELMPFFMLLKRQVERNDKPVPASLTFGIHSLLTSILVIQGDGDFQRLATTAKESFNKFFNQLDDATSTKNNTPNFFKNIKNFKPLVYLSKPIGRSCTDTSEINAFWNPLVAGELLLFTTYVASFGMGSVCIDSIGQLRMTLHLYNALKERELVEDVKLLDILDKSFKDTKAVWVGGRPSKGSFVKGFWMSWGASINEASKLSSTTQGINKYSSTSTNSFLKGLNSGKITRNMEEILPEHFSDSYRRIVLSDYSNGAENYSVRNASKEIQKVNRSFLDTIIRTNTTRDSMDEDEDLLPLNLPLVGSILNEFILELTVFLGWSDSIDRLISTCPLSARNGVRTTGRKARVGGFETADTNLQRQAIAHFFTVRLLGELDFADTTSYGVKSAKFMVDFFSGVNPDQYNFFVIDEPKISNNPLKGSYPFGQTGKTASDPLVSRLVLKFTKRRNHKVRCIKPGKRTPVAADFDAASNPYFPESSTFKLEQSIDGKYRHITSYSLEELIDLGWDGAKYFSSTQETWAPYIPGYDSDSDDEYEAVPRSHIKLLKKAGIIGLTLEDKDKYMLVAKNFDDDPSLVRLNK